MSVHSIQSHTASAASRVAFIQSSWHREIVDQCRQAFAEEMASHGMDNDGIDFHAVAGAFEIPLLAQRLARSGKYSAVVATGLVVDGGIYRHDFVAQAVISGLMQVQLDTGVPMISAVLTPHHFHAGQEHQQFFREHFRVKGREAALACIDTVSKLQALA
ncbi:MAG: 6,7-dimethyl-8-ribityllumazine synthase [Janthinobacterium lividum]